MNRKINRDSGFTVIEVLLFLAVSGMMIAALLVGTGVAIQRQQYRDAVYSYADFLSSEYSKVISVHNDRSDEDSCPISEAVSGRRGQSDCLIVGRYLQTVDDQGRSYQSYPIYAYNGSGGWQYSYGESQVETYDAEWGVKTRLSSASSSDLTYSILRHPETGRISMSVNQGRYSPSTIAESIVSGSSQEVSEICVYDDDWFAGTRQSVFIGKSAASGDAVSVKLASEDCNG